MSLLTAFVNQTINFLEDLENVFPENNDIKTYKKLLIFTKKTNPRLILESFNLYVYPFHEKIINKDESFFMELDYDEKQGGSEDSMLKAIEIKELWKIMTEHSKTACWNYFIVLVKLSEQLKNKY